MIVRSPSDELSNARIPLAFAPRPLLAFGWVGRRTMMCLSVRGTV